MGEIRIKRDNSDWDNRPAHQLVNGQWVDIPTHHYTNGRWQGELTSQSPLKFRADGDMLDWRVEGRTSGNLIDNWEYGDIDTNGNPVDTTDLMRTGYIPIEVDKIYSISREITTGYWKVRIYDINKTYIGSGIGNIDLLWNIGELTPGNPMQNGTSFTKIKPIAGNAYFMRFVCNGVNFSENAMMVEGDYIPSTIPEYEPYGGVGDWDETAQKYKIPVRVEGENLFDINGDYSAYMYQGSPTCRVDNGQIIVNVVPYYFAHIKFSALIPSGQYTIKYKASANFRATRLLLTKPFDTGTWNESYKCYYADMVKNDNYYTYTFTVDEDFAIGFAISGTTGDTGTIDEIMLNEGTAAFPYEGITTTLYTDHQLMEGDSIDYATTETQIPIATGSNTLTVDTAVQPKSVFVKFEG